MPPDIQAYAPSEISTDLPLRSYALPTSGIYYLNAAVGAAGVPEPLLPWVPFFSYAFTKMGTRRHDYAEMARRMDAVTGGVGLNSQVRVLCGKPNSCLPFIQISAKCLNRNIDTMYGIVEELVDEIDFGNLKRFAATARRIPLSTGNHDRTEWSPSCHLTLLEGFRPGQCPLGDVARHRTDQDHSRIH